MSVLSRVFPLASPGGRACVLYEWPIWDGCLAVGLAPQAVRIPAHRHDTVDAVCRRIPPAAKVFLFHVDATFTADFPPSRRALVETLTARGIHVINGAVTDISKRTLQQRCRTLGLNSVAAPREGDPDEVLIVKTNYNGGAYTERRCSPRLRRALGVGRITGVIRGDYDYKILPRRQVDEAWWRDDQLVIERYIDNRRHRIIRVYVVGDRLAVSDVVEHAAIRKMGHYESRLNSFLVQGESGVEVVHRASDFPQDAVSQTLALAADMSLEFGATDLTMDDAGNCYIIDVNTAPGYCKVPQPGLGDHLCGPLNTGAAGVWRRTPRWRLWWNGLRSRF